MLLDPRKEPERRERPERPVPEFHRIGDMRFDGRLTSGDLLGDNYGRIYAVVDADTVQRL